MTLRLPLLAVLAATLLPAAVSAAPRELCPERPGLDTPPCTVDPGRLMAEVSIADWTHDAGDGEVEDTVLIGDVVLRYGIADHAELRLAWTAFGHDRLREDAGLTKANGVGDVTLGVKRNLLDPTGEGFSVALLGEVTLPTGGRAIGAGDWGAAVAVPVNLPLTGPLSLVFTPEVDAMVDADGHGRHLAYGSAGGLVVDATDRLSLSLEASIVRDRDPEGHETRALVAANAALILDPDSEVDIGSAFALNHAAPDSRVYVGFSRRF